MRSALKSVYKKLGKPRFFSRKAVTRPNPIYFLWRYVGNGRRTFRALSVPRVFEDASQIAKELDDRGFVVGPSDKFLSESGRRALADASATVLAISRSNEVETAIATGINEKKKDYMVTLVGADETFSPDNPLVRVALDVKLLEIVSSYLGLWPRLYSIAAWLNFPTNADAKESQLWHRDPEDMKLIKTFIYLADVDESRGPFCYIPSTHPFSPGAAKTPKHKARTRVTDEEMRAMFPQDAWVSCTGPAGTMILADTVGYHRGGRPTRGNRILITFTYTSGIPFTRRKLRLTERPTWLKGIQSCAV